MVQLSHPYMATGKTTALTRWTFVSKVMSLLFFFLTILGIILHALSECIILHFTLNNYWEEAACSVTLRFDPICK